MADDATLELTLLSTDGLKDSTFINKSKPLFIVWIDPALKKSLKTLAASSTLHLPLSPHALRNPSSSSLTIQILLSSRLPFRLSPKPIATAVLPLSSIPLAGDVLTLPLKRPSGRPQGSLRVSVRILWCLGAPSPPPPVHPTAPPMPEGQCVAPPMPDYHSEEEEIEGSNSVDRNAPPGLPDYHSEEDSTGCGDMAEEEEEETEGSNCVDRNAPPGLPDGQRAWRSFLMGLVSGTVAAVLVGAAGLSEG